MYLAISSGLEGIENFGGMLMPFPRDMLVSPHSGLLRVLFLGGGRVSTQVHLLHSYALGRSKNRPDIERRSQVIYLFEAISKSDPPQRNKRRENEREAEKQSIPRTMISGIFSIAFSASETFGLSPSSKGAAPCTRSESSISTARN